MIKIEKKFDLEKTIFSGQCFRMKKEDNHLKAIINDRILKIIEKENEYEIYSNNEKNLNEVVINYFDLKRDYNKINRELISKDKSMKEVAISDYRILNQDKFEMFISYIISQNNNVKRISYSVNKLCELFGEKIEYENNIYYLFPKKENLLKIDITDLKECKLGFRDKYIMNAINEIKKDPSYLDNIAKKTTIDAMKELMKIKGIGPKVASCILMFGFNRLDSYPIDTWAKKYLSEKYNATNIRELQSKLHNVFGEYVGLAVQYMFNYERNIKVNKK